ncbi:PF14213 domain protein [Leptospira noguchii serovar Autumnalis str. ZUN142]|uniref:PF14213 domain protein n=1 Tax=Leptospira noguchii serovar Autumnalis str. ZUN142 TaxID=1085540 RepID=M6U3C7_9LEPT|nr:STAS-like domain-containing protein [Leptospira noguchii]EMO39517.1 PF14213 domain protein [Leptospira noguchii serovar Autumnalis str. ZUN142]
MITKIKIAKDFTDVVGHRYRIDGPKSGEEFREDFLEPILNDSNIKTIEIDMDDTWGYPSSFLEECFGGLVRKYGIDLVKGKIKIISNQDESLQERIKEIINKAKKE